MTRPLSLSDRQLAFLRRAASAVPVDQRNRFLRRVAAHLSGEPSDQAVEAAINAALDLVPIDGMCRCA